MLSFAAEQPKKAILASLRTAKRQVRRLRTRFRRRALILVYHRIATVESDPWGLCVSEKHFAQQMRVLKAHADPIPLQTLTAAREDRDLPERPICVTFDDGYIDNLQAAAPILEQLRVPATMFLTTGFFSKTREHWWDELDRLVLGPGQRPERLTLQVQDRVQTWNLPASSGVRTTEAVQNWRAWEIAIEPRQALYQALYDTIASLNAEERQAALEQIEAWSGASADRRPGYRSVSEAEALELARSRYIEIGAHTVSHPVLAHLPAEEQKQEILSSKTALEQLINRPVNSFAYPFGKRSHYSSVTKMLLQECGLHCGCSNFWGVVTTKTDRYELPRVQVLDSNGDVFAKEVNLWFRG
jgi:peptidoglycan/xylan/chitin deacetylase (PgdA/CDA1 family)